MSDPVIRRVRRSIDEAKNRGGMQTGMPKVTIDAADAERLCILSEGLIKATSEAGWHERQKWAAEEQLTTAQAENEALVEALEKIDAMPHYDYPLRFGCNKPLHDRYECILQTASEALAAHRKQGGER